VELADDERGDYLHGLAGIGVGHLILQGMAPSAANLAIAATCARRLLAGQATMPKDAVAPVQPGSGVAVETGFAHGRAGVAAFLLAYHRACGDPAAGAAARDRFAELASEAEDLIGDLAGLNARPMGVSWCQGMAGIVSALVSAANFYGDRYLDLARDGARACRALAPQVWVLSQCCGLAGIGEAIIDVALATGEDEFWQAAADIAELILIRSGGDFAHPVFPDGSSDAASGSWGVGTPGVLSFLRRLHRRGNARLWTPQWSPPAAPLAT
jgi:lantibiotic modifying enzyme